MWRLPFVTEKADIPEDMSDEQIVEILNAQYAQLMDFQTKLVRVMSEDTTEQG